MSATLTETLCFNFLVVGQERSGSAALASSLCGLPGTHVHVGLLDRDEAVRRHAAERYFDIDPEEAAAAAANPAADPPWFRDGVTNPYHYLLATVFDRPRRGEVRIGVRADYGFTRSYQISDTVEELYRRGDFCVVHVHRNPVACLASLKQAEKFARWGRLSSQRDDADAPPAVRLDPGELTRFVRDHYAEERRLAAACPDAIHVQYRDLCLDFDHQVRRVAAYVEAPCERVALPCVRRMRNRPVADRVYNFADLLTQVPSDVRAAMTAADLY